MTRSTGRLPARTRRAARTPNSITSIKENPMTDPEPAVTMREIRERLGHKVPPPGVPEPTVLPCSYVVSCLPIGHDERWEYTINVRHQQDGLYAVQHGQKLYGADGTWEREPGWPETGIDEGTVWLAAHRFDHDTALRLARELAPRLTYRGRTVADVLAEGAQR